MLNELIDRALPASMAAVLIVPELATFTLFVGFAAGFALFVGQFAWSLLSDPQPPVT
jgi:hypothetical protein